jgi:hypothetical protein
VSGNQTGEVVFLANQIREDKSSFMKSGPYDVFRLGWICILGAACANAICSDSAARHVCAWANNESFDQPTGVCTKFPFSTTSRMVLGRFDL